MIGIKRMFVGAIFFSLSLCAQDHVGITLKIIESVTEYARDQTMDNHYTETNQRNKHKICIMMNGPIFGTTENQFDVEATEIPGVTCDGHCHIILDFADGEPTLSFDTVRITNDESTELKMKVKLRFIEGDHQSYEGGNEVLLELHQDDVTQMAEAEKAIVSKALTQTMAGMQAELSTMGIECTDLAITKFGYGAFSIRCTKDYVKHSLTNVSLEGEFLLKRTGI